MVVWRQKITGTKKSLTKNKRIKKGTFSRNAWSASAQDEFVAMDVLKKSSSSSRKAAATLLKEVRCPNRLIFTTWPRFCGQLSSSLVQAPLVLVLEFSHQLATAFFSSSTPILPKVLDWAPQEIENGLNKVYNNLTTIASRQETSVLSRLFQRFLITQSSNNAESIDFLHW